VPAPGAEEIDPTGAGDTFAAAFAAATLAGAEPVEAARAATATAARSVEHQGPMEAPIDPLFAGFPRTGPPRSST
jgi:sugar/nucleoside kinase (ribokinase family)